MPKKGSTLNFKHFFKSMRVPFIVYADFKSFTQKLDATQPNPDDSHTKPYQKHTPSGLCYYIKCFDDEVYKRIKLKQIPVIYTKQTKDEDGEEKEVKHELRFIDSFKFMASSLDKLVGNLQKDQFINLECGASGTLCQTPERVTVNKVEKLIPNLNNKTKYVVHYENLKLYESLGLKITKIHRAVHMKKTKIRFDKPVYLGMCILDLSKTLMYNFHYNYIKPNYILDAYGSSGAKLLFTDTDSLAYEIKTVDFYADINENVEQMFDTSNFPADHPSGIKSGVNKKVVGMFKDECGRKIMHEFVGLRAKLYSYRMYEGNEPLARPKEEKRCKGVKQSVVKKEINFDDYKACLKRADTKNECNTQP
ncbi:hypothetical protein MAR_013875 [Mya arenaria]|uniref:Uncharacterized protein n=1 Tax=Mya arenaria TaxID=6604 RepID=A0ABY7G538_MYAAR|nr:hypothetical protein MAR_013875 [Mya arenaria]